MSTVTLKNEIKMNTAGELPQKGSMAPDFKAVKNDLSEIKLSDLKGKRVVINIFPSIDTGVCAASVRRFNKEASELKNTVVLCLSQDLPFAQARFCGAEGLTNVVTVSTFRNPEFNQGYGMLLKDGPMAGLMARSVVVVDEGGKVIYTELVGEVTNEPNYEAALACLK
ncbi:peroxidase [Porphyromonas macacae]|uniref:Thiol peroxidase n=1 Tax=Porphyromonas macacae TaxID=28115 RepID=A0A0A2E5H8_9PORP|nr:thiol peroxidase [Porphyromonas macacae]KGN74163.1 peroxidase [Porphyromonas macacae]